MSGSTSDRGGDPAERPEAGGAGERPRTPGPSPRPSRGRPRPRRRVLRSAWEVARTILVAFALYLIVRAFAVEAFKIPTSSMESTLLVGDFLLVNKAVYGAEIPGTDLHLPALEEPSRSDVVVFRPPHDPIRNYVKRVVGLPGDLLEMRDKVLYVNGVPQPEPYASHSGGIPDAGAPAMLWQESFLTRPERRGGYRPTRDNWGPIEVPRGRYFVLGDNRDNSEDSRYWGFVQRDAIRGRPWFVYYSFRPSASDGLDWIRDIRWRRIGGQIR